jgi:hypothetical protein
MKKRIYAFLIFALLISSIGKAQDSLKVKEDSLDFRYKYYASLGGFFPFTNSTIQLNPKDRGFGTIISLEDMFNMDENPSLVNAGAYTRISKHSTLNASYFYMSRSGHIGGTDREIQIGDTSVSVGAELNITSKLSYFGLTYNYLFIAKPDWHAGLSFGVRALHFDLDLNYRLQSETGSYSSDLTVPIALLGLNAQGFMLPRLRGSYSFEMFRLSVNSVSGVVYENRFSLEYFLLENLGVGFGYNNILYNVNEIPFSKSFEGNIKYNISGVAFYLTGRF